MKVKSYDPFNLPEPTKEEQRQRHFLDSNGLWLNDDSKYLKEKCLCGCTAQRHLDGNTICLNSNCICEGFIKERTKVVVLQKQYMPKK